MMKKSIEIGHIYQDMELDDNYLDILKKSIKVVEENRELCNYKILIDDLNVEKKKWNEEDLILFLKENEIDIDNIAYESKFSKIGHIVENKLNKDKLLLKINKNDKIYYIKSGNKKVKIKTVSNNKTRYSCAFLSACWQLCRLGIFDYPDGTIKTINRVAEKEYDVLNIIEKKYKKVEDNVRVILIEFDIQDRVTNKLI